MAAKADAQIVEIEKNYKVQLAEARDAVLSAAASADIAASGAASARRSVSRTGQAEMLESSKIKELSVDKEMVERKVEGLTRSLEVTQTNLKFAEDILKKTAQLKRSAPPPPAQKPVVEEPKVEEPKVEEPRIEELKVEELKVEEPKVEEPKVEEPKAEEPKAEEPKAEEPTPPAPVPFFDTKTLERLKDLDAPKKAPTVAPEKPEIEVEEPKVEEPKVEEPKVEEPKVEEPKAEEPKVEELKVEEPKAEELKVEEPTPPTPVPFFAKERHPWADLTKAKRGRLTVAVLSDFLEEKGESTTDPATGKKFLKKILLQKVEDMIL